MTYGIPAVACSIIAVASLLTPSSPRAAPRVAPPAPRSPTRRHRDTSISPTSAPATSGSASLFRTKAQVLSSIVSQRGECNPFWDVRMQANGVIGVETDGGDYTVLLTANRNGEPMTVNDGAKHDVVVARAKGTLRVWMIRSPAPHRAAPPSACWSRS